MLDRRQFVTAAAAAALAAPHIARASQPLTLWGPPASPSLLLCRTS